MAEIILLQGNLRIAFWWIDCGLLRRASVAVEPQAYGLEARFWISSLIVLLSRHCSLSAGEIVAPRCPELPGPHTCASIYSPSVFHLPSGPFSNTIR